MIQLCEIWAQKSSWYSYLWGERSDQTQRRQPPRRASLWGRLVWNGPSRWDQEGREPLHTLWGSVLKRARRSESKCGSCRCRVRAATQRQVITQMCSSAEAVAWFSCSPSLEQVTALITSLMQIYRTLCCLQFRENTAAVCAGIHVIVFWPKKKRKEKDGGMSEGDKIKDDNKDMWRRPGWRTWWRRGRCQDTKAAWLNSGDTVESCSCSVHLSWCTQTHHALSSWRAQFWSSPPSLTPNATTNTGLL